MTFVPDRDRMGTAHACRAFKLLSQTELLNASAVTVDVLLLQVSEKVSSVTDHLQHTAAGMEILGVCLEVCVELVDACSQNGDLHLGRTGIGLVGLVGSDNCLLGFLLDHGVSPHKNISFRTAYGG